MIRSFKYLILNLLLSPWVYCQANDTCEVLHSGIPTEIYIAPGRSTTVVLRTKEHVSSISLSSPIITYKYDKVLNQIEITATGRTAGLETNLNVRIGPDVYVLIIKIVNDVRVQFVRIFSFESGVALSDESALMHARALKPAYIDLLGAVKVIERMQNDLVYRHTHLEVQHADLKYSYVWNDCFITLESCDQFIDKDLLVFRIVWTNNTHDALYLDTRQLALFIGDKNLPITATTRKALGNIITPGKKDVIYLAIQGYRISRSNAFEFRLPAG